MRTGDYKGRKQQERQPYHRANIQREVLGRGKGRANLQADQWTGPDRREKRDACQLDSRSTAASSVNTYPAEGEKIANTQDNNLHRQPPGRRSHPERMLKRQWGGTDNEHPLNQQPNKRNRRYEEIEIGSGTPNRLAWTGNKTRTLDSSCPSRGQKTLREYFPLHTNGSLHSSSGLRQPHY